MFDTCSSVPKRKSQNKKKIQKIDYHVKITREKNSIFGLSLKIMNTNFFSVENYNYIITEPLG